MEHKILVPQAGESIIEATIADWHIKENQECAEGDVLVELETDKISLEITAPKDGILKKIYAPNSTQVKIGEVIALFEEKALSSTSTKSIKFKEEVLAPSKALASSSVQETNLSPNQKLAPGAAVYAKEQQINPSSVEGTGKRGQVRKADLVHYNKNKQSENFLAGEPLQQREIQEREVRKPMSPLRKRIAERLLSAQHNAAILTTFNEIDMQASMDLRKKYKTIFQEKHGVGLGFMSIFIKASIQALKEFPALNAEIDGETLVYKNYYDIGVAVGGPKGLIVPVIRDTQDLSFPQIEQTIARLANQVKEATIELKNLEGGSFTISNGGVYGSMLSTPIVNPPQSGILGMHNIVKRPVVINDEICIRPIMYVALSYDHRIVDGKEAVSFLVRLKELIEEPERLLLNL